MDKLVIITKKFTKEFKVPEGDITIGRSLDNTLCLNDETISRHHAKIFKQNGQLYIMDLGSYNGTLINGQKIPSKVAQSLQNNDQIIIGDYQIICKFGLADEKPSSSVAEELGFDLDEISSDTEENLEGLAGTLLGKENKGQENIGSEGLGGDLDLDAITDDSPASLPGQKKIDPSHLQTVRYRNIEEEQTTPEEPLPGSKNPFAQASGADSAQIMEKHTRATMRMPVYREMAPSEDDPHAFSTEEILSLNASLVVDIDGKEQSYSLNQPLITIGRGRENDIVLSHFSVSKYHAKIAYEQGEFVLYDLNTTNGTMVNDSMIQRCVLAHGDTLNFGQVYGVFYCEAFPRRPKTSEFGELDIAKMLVLFQVLQKKQLKEALREAQEHQKSLKQVLLTKGLVNPLQWSQAKEALKAQGGLPNDKPKMILLGALALVVLLLALLLVWGIGKILQKKRMGKILYDKGVALLEKKEYQKILQEIPLSKLELISDKKAKKKILKIHLKARYYLGKRYFQEKKWKKGLSEWKKIIQLLNPEDELYKLTVEELFWNFLDRLKKEAAQGNFNKLVQIYEDARREKQEMEGTPKSYDQFLREGAQILQKYGEQALKKDQFLKAKEFFSRILYSEIKDKTILEKANVSIRLARLLNKISKDTPEEKEMELKNLNALKTELGKYFPPSHFIWQKIQTWEK
ncbi:MAG: FHA domain-containing protein [Planctomycetota bacterium]|nr:MAG: FHA domain-containing protein [Planctomycetota bacterium]